MKNKKFKVWVIVDGETGKLVTFENSLYVAQTKKYAEYMRKAYNGKYFKYKVVRGNLNV